MAPPRKFDHDEARLRREAGETLREIAESYGVSDTAVLRVTNPRVRARMDAAAARFMRERYRQACAEPGCDRIVWVHGTRRSGYCQKHCRPITAEHGTESMYVRHGCRCGLCVAGASAAKRIRRQRAKVPCSGGCGRMVQGTNRRNPDKPFECRSCAMKRVNAERRAA